MKEWPGKKKNATKTRSKSHENSRSPSVPGMDSEEQHINKIINLLACAYCNCNEKLRTGKVRNIGQLHLI